MFGAQYLFVRRFALEKENVKIAEGFSFNSEKDAQLAGVEKKKIEYLETKLDYSNPQAISKIYEKAIHDRIFKTPVGIIFLKKLQDFLVSDKNIKNEEIIPIPIFQSFDEELRRYQNPAKNRIQPSKAKKDKTSFMFLSVMLNVLLIIAIIAMFAITINSDQPNIINYRSALVNQYSEWEQNLTEREAVVREKEKELLWTD